MRNSETTALPSDLLEVQTRFERWRQERRVKGAVPAPLMAAAAAMAREHGVSKVAKALRMNGRDLRNRMEHKSVTTSGDISGPEFVEIPRLCLKATPPPQSQSGLLVPDGSLVIEMRAPDGAFLIVRSAPGFGVDVTALCASFWRRGA